jgi:hypothetical protein
MSFYKRSIYFGSNLYKTLTVHQMYFAPSERLELPKDFYLHARVTTETDTLPVNLEQNTLANKTWILRMDFRHHLARTQVLRVELLRNKSWWDRGVLAPVLKVKSFLHHLNASIPNLVGSTGFEPASTGLRVRNNCHLY